LLRRPGLLAGRPPLRGPSLLPLPLLPLLRLRRGRGPTLDFGETTLHLGQPSRQLGKLLLEFRAIALALCHSYRSSPHPNRLFVGSYPG
jgi:hypothetical protein